MPINVILILKQNVPYSWAWGGKNNVRLGCIDILSKIVKESFLTLKNTSYILG